MFVIHKLIQIIKNVIKSQIHGKFFLNYIFDLKNKLIVIDIFRLSPDL